MNAVPFDTLRMAQRLEAAGLSGPQAAGASEALAEALVGADLATRADINALRSELKGDIAAFRTEMKGEFGLVRAEIELVRRDITIRLGGMLVLGFGVVAALIRLMPAHP
jgi:hypothetical protein